MCGRSSYKYILGAISTRAKNKTFYSTLCQKTTTCLSYFQKQEQSLTVTTEQIQQVSLQFINAEIYTKYEAAIAAGGYIDV